MISWNWKKSWATPWVMLKSSDTWGSERFKPVQSVKEENIKKVDDINAFERKCFDSKGIKNSLETKWSSPEILPEGLF